ncbi:MAG: RecQ family ATP-dependent DNA helicase [Chloroflexi bacterium]|nr:RecQ family ATP-dependent DNA helicase [Chloroflexota bacterium]
MAFCPECGEVAQAAPPHPGDLPAPAPAPRPLPRPAATPATAGAPAPARLPTELYRYRQRLRDTFGYPDFRDGQATVLSALATSDVLAVMPTGSGKSLCYVLPALEVGRTVVVSPLIALMQDQVEGLQAAGVAATFINSNVGRDELNRRYADFIAGRTSLLYVAPERFANARFTEGLRRAGVNLFAVDEAHCISEWGHNFRPDYLLLGAIRARLGNPRTLALTATANPRVRRDVLARLGLSGRAQEVVTTVDRPNLLYSVHSIGSPADRTRWVIDYAQARPGQAGIVYARTRRSVDELASALQAAGVQAAAYHAGLGREERSTVQRRFTVGDLPVIVATNAFGMGVDKPDVRYVVHFNMPARLESYYQEAGRGGRDGDPAECTLLFAPSDRRVQQRMIEQSHPDAAAVRDTWRRWVTLARSSDGRLPSGLADGDVERFAITVAALRHSGLIEPVALSLTSLDPDAAIDLSSITEHRAYAEARLREMSEYAETDHCRRALILRYFGETPEESCERCDICLGTATTERADYPSDLFEGLLDLREQIARQSGRDPSRVFELRTARELAEQRPRTREQLLAVWGMGERRADWFGRELVAAIDEWNAAHPDAPPPSVAPPASGRRSSGGSGRAARSDRDARDPGIEAVRDDPLFDALRRWRSGRAREDGVPAYVLFSDRTMRELVAVRPGSRDELLGVWGLGEARVERFGEALLGVIRDPETAPPERGEPGR